jgi:hypothetical protein
MHVIDRSRKSMKQNSANDIGAPIERRLFLRRMTGGVTAGVIAISTPFVATSAQSISASQRAARTRGTQIRIHSLAVPRKKD